MESVFWRATGHVLHRFRTSRSSESGWKKVELRENVSHIGTQVFYAEHAEPPPSPLKEDTARRAERASDPRADGDAAGPAQRLHFDEENDPSGATLTRRERVRAEDSAKLRAAAITLFDECLPRGCEHKGQKPLWPDARVAAKTCWAAVARYCLQRAAASRQHDAECSTQTVATSSVLVLAPRVAHRAEDAWDQAVAVTPSGARVIHPGRLTAVPHSQQAKVMAHVLAFDQLTSDRPCCGVSLQLDALVGFTEQLTGKHGEWELDLSVAFEAMDARRDTASCHATVSGEKKRKKQICDATTTKSAAERVRERTAVSRLSLSLSRLLFEKTTLSFRDAVACRFAGRQERHGQLPRNPQLWHVQPRGLPAPRRHL